MKKTADRLKLLAFLTILVFPLSANAEEEEFEFSPETNIPAAFKNVAELDGKTLNIKAFNGENISIDVSYAGG